METGFARDVLLSQIGVSPPRQHASVPRDEGFRRKAKEARQIDMTACTLLAVLATGRLPEGAVAAEEFADPKLRAVCEALLDGQSVASLMESQPDDEGRATIGVILNIQTEEDDASLMRMAQDCLRRMRRARLESELEEIQRSLPNVAEGERSVQTERAVRLMTQLRQLEDS
jgi:hypothetical protein